MNDRAVDAAAMAIQAENKRLGYAESYQVIHGYAKVAVAASEPIIRAQIAAEIEARTPHEPSWSVDSGMDCGYWEGLTEAARIARGAS